jgi:hypothetical protein
MGERTNPDGAWRPAVTREHHRDVRAISRQIEDGAIVLG